MVTIQGILNEVAAKHNITVEELTSRLRRRDITAARHEAMWRMSQEKIKGVRPHWSYFRIVSALNLKNHTSAVHGIRAHAKRMEQHEQR
jgi:chromosomal replication initiation ATPase DnaA